MSHQSSKGAISKSDDPAKLKSVIRDLEEELREKAAEAACFEAEAR